MDTEQKQSLVAALRKAVSSDREWGWAWLAQGSDDEALLVVALKEEVAQRDVKKARATAKDARWSSGTLAAADGVLTFTIGGGSAALGIVKKSVTKELAKAKGLTTAKTWLSEALFAESVAPAPTGDGLGISSRSAVEASSKTTATKASEKHGTDYVRFLESLEGWHRKFGDGVPDDQRGEARALLDAIEARANAWHASHKAGRLESKKNKRRRAEVQRVLNEVAEARKRLLVLLGDAYTEEDLALIQAADELALENQKEAEVEQFQTWKGLVEERLTGIGDDDGTELASGSFGRVVRYTGRPQVVAKFQTDRAKRDRPNDLETEASNYETVGPHPNLVRAYGVTEVQGEKALVLEDLEGGSMEDLVRDGRAWVESGKLTQREYIGMMQHVVRGIVNGLRHLHEQGYRHLDLKPANVMIDSRTGMAKLVDLGTMHDRGLHATQEYRAGLTREDYLAGLGSDGIGLALSLFEAMEGDLPDYRPDLVPVGDAATGVTPRWDSLSEDEQTNWRTTYDERTVREIESARRRLAKERFLESRAETGVGLYQQGTGPSKMVKPMMGALQDFVNRLFDADPTRRPNLEEMQRLPFLEDALLSSDEASALMERLPELRA